MSKREIEIDVDGVLANLDGAYYPYICDIIPDYTEEKYITGWDMPLIQENYPEAFKRILALWDNPIFIYNLKPFIGVELGLNKLYREIKDDAEIVIHTHIRGEDDVYKARYNWIEDLMKRSKIQGKIEISRGVSKDTRKNSFIVVEDNPMNLVKSNAENKFLIRQAHNREFDLRDVGVYKNGFIKPDFYSCVPDIVKCIRGEYV